MADNWFFAGDILRLEAQALVKAAECSAHSQLVHDCSYYSRRNQFERVREVLKLIS